MGINDSKLASKLPETEVEEKGSIPSTPILTTKIARETNIDEDVDPRSPSNHIARTPLQLLTTAAKKLEELEISAHDQITTPNVKKTFVLGIDPRSPTTDFNRTPIVFNSNDEKIPGKLHNKNLDKARRGSILSTPKLLESSPLTSSKNANKRKSYVGLLETNIDYTETDLDVALKEKNSNNTPFSTPKTIKTSIATCSLDPRSPTTDFVRTPILLSNSGSQSDQNIEEKAVEDLEKNDTEESLPTSEINNSNDGTENIAIVTNDNGMDMPEEKSEILPNEWCVKELNELPGPADGYNQLEEKQDAFICDAVIPEDEAVTALTPMDNIPLKESSSKSAPLIDITADVIELDKKLSNLIYEDKDTLPCPKIVKLKEQTRLPLGVRNSLEVRKSVSKLKVSDKPRKSDYVVSKIPVMKDKQFKPVQCENTPPKYMSTKKRQSHWDGDKTLVI